MYSALIEYNTFIENTKGIYTNDNSNVIIALNYFINNTINAESHDDVDYYYSYPKGGNYWSDHQTRDVKKGANQNFEGSDGFADDPYYIVESNIDLYPIFFDNTPPEANAGGNRTILQGESVFFNGKLSSDDQMIVYYSWIMENNNHITFFNKSDFTYLFHKAGTYQFTLIVKDFNNNSDIDRITIEVLDNEAPIPIMDDLIINQGETAIFNGSKSLDNVNISNFTWRFTYNNTIVILYGNMNYYKFNIPGEYNCSLFLSDERGNLGESFFTIIVIDTENPIAKYTGLKNFQTLGIKKLDGSLSIDNGKIELYEWTIIRNNDIQILFGKIIFFSFDFFDLYQIFLKVTDSYNNSDIISFQILIEDITPPTIVIDGNRNLSLGDEIVLNASKSSDNNYIEKYYWMFFENDILYIGVSA